MAFDIQWDYRFADSNWFTDGVRSVLDQAAAIWSQVIRDDFPAVPTGTEFTVREPGTGEDQRVSLQTPIDDLRVFVGATEGLSELAHGGYTGTDAVGDAYRARISGDFRGQGPVTDFEPFAGTLTFDAGTDWDLDPSGDGSGRFDLLSTALHELGHVLGIGTAPIYEEWVDDGRFTGPNSRQANDGQGLPLAAGDDAHVEDGYSGGDVLMDPTLAPGGSKEPTRLDQAILADIGYTIDGFEAQGATPALTTDQADRPVLGTNQADTLDGQGGDDRIQGNDGGDTLTGGAGEDVLFGQKGDDTLIGGPGPDQLQGGPGADLLIADGGTDTLVGGAGADVFAVPAGAGSVTIQDFAVGTETLHVAPDWGYGDAKALLEAVTKPYTNVSRIPLGDEGHVDLVHAAQQGTPLTAADFRIGTAQSNRPPQAKADTATTPADTAIILDVLANDSAPDGSALSITAVAAPSHGQTERTDAGTIHYTPAQDFRGTDSFRYTVTDGQGDTATAEATITVTADGDRELIATTLDGTPAEFGLAQGVRTELVGDTSGHTLRLGPDTAATNIDPGTDVHIAGESAAYTYSRDGTTLRITDGKGAVKAVLNGAPDAASTVHFLDGQTPLGVDTEAGTLTLAGHTLADGATLAGRKVAAGLTDDAGSGPTLAGPPPASHGARDLIATTLDQTPDRFAVGSGVTVEMVGDTSGHTLNVPASAAVTNVDPGSTVNLEVEASALTLTRDGTTLRLTDGDGGLRAVLNAAPGEASEVRFLDGGLTLGVDTEAGTLTAGGQALSDGASVDGSNLQLNPDQTSRDVFPAEETQNLDHLGGALEPGGGPMPEADQSLNVNETDWGADLGHGSIDDADQVLELLGSHLQAEMPVTG